MEHDVIYLDYYTDIFFYEDMNRFKHTMINHVVISKDQYYIIYEKIIKVLKYLCCLILLLNIISKKLPNYKL